MKRVAISTISSVPTDPNRLDNEKKSASKSSGDKKRSNKKDDKPRTVRFDIRLPDTTDDSFPEFSYKELVKELEKREKRPDGSNYDPDDPFNEQEEDEKLQAIARQFEMKYSAKKKYRASAEDYIDKGFGYDENDSFIDNEEAYDELIPSSITTKHGGFYINVGKLEFRTCSDDEGEAVLIEDDQDSQEIIRKSTKKRRSKLDDSLNKSSHARKKKRMRILSSDDEDERPNEKDDEEDDARSRDLNSEGNEPSSSSDDELIVRKKDKSESHMQTIDSVIDSVIKSQSKPKSSKVDAPSSNSSSDDVLILNDSNMKSLEVPPRVNEILSAFREMNVNQGEKKQRVFTNEMNDLALELELAIVDLKSIHRLQVYTNLANILGSSRDATIKRVKKLRVTHEENKLRTLISTLRSEVRSSLDSQEEEWDEQCELLHDQWEADREKGIVVSDKPKFPDKQFRFNESIKSCLRKILASKRLLVEFAGIKGKQEEDNITNFFNNEIKNVWLSGWVSKDQLLKMAGFVSKYCDRSAKSTSVSVINKPASTPTLAINQSTSTTVNNLQPSKVSTTPKLSMVTSNGNPETVSITTPTTASTVVSQPTINVFPAVKKETTPKPVNKVVSNPSNPTWHQPQPVNQSKPLDTSSVTPTTSPSTATAVNDRTQPTKSSIEPEGLLYSIKKMARSSSQLQPNQSPISDSNQRNVPSKESKISMSSSKINQLKQKELQAHQSQILQKMRQSFTGNSPRSSVLNNAQQSLLSTSASPSTAHNLSQSKSAGNLSSMKTSLKLSYPINASQSQQQQQHQQQHQQPKQLQQQQQHQSANSNQLNYQNAGSYMQILPFPGMMNNSTQRFLAQQKAMNAGQSNNDMAKDLSTHRLSNSTTSHKQQIPITKSVQQSPQPSLSTSVSSGAHLIGQSTSNKANKALDVDYKFDHAIKRSLIEEAKKSQPSTSTSNTATLSKSNPNVLYSSLSNSKVTANAETLFQQLLQQRFMPNVATSLPSGAQQNNMNIALQRMYLSQLCQQQMAATKKDKQTPNNNR